MRRIFASLVFYNYRLWFAGALVANIGTWMQRVAQDWVVLTVLTDNSGFAVGVVTALQFIPTVVLTPYAGVIADRFNRRKILVLTQAMLGLLALGLGIFILTGIAELWHVYVFASLLGVVSAFDAPARQVFVSELVPTSQLGNAVSLNSASFNAARLIGPGVAGLGIAVVGPGWIFIINAVSFAGTILAVVVMRASELQPVRKTKRESGQLRAGFDYVRRRTDILVIMVTIFVVSSLALHFQLTSAVIATQVFHRGAGEYGILGSAMAIGSLAGALMAARRSRPRVRLVVISAFGYGISAGLMAIMPTYELFLIMTIPVGFFTLTMMTAANAAIQIGSDPAMRGRVMSLYLVVLFGAKPVGAPLIGWIAEAVGGRWAIGVGAIAAILVAIAAAIWTKRNWGVEVTYSLRTRPHVLLTHPEERELQDQVGVDLAAQQARDRAA
ncbi:MFS transporter [Pseudactinotalea sp. HY160]|uniref:MFS transporter n=1 Tax=Pseudactinotalea sp. HY160 TaxID=2654490 RepID=UPI00128C7591|nr:MFS transporter [Pseudactinotalea sp. HY160]MPV48572.1 MFS transporter [Pseudactinotalea sp. HY160]